MRQTPLHHARSRSMIRQRWEASDVPSDSPPTCRVSSGPPTCRVPSDAPLTPLQSAASPGSTPIWRCVSSDYPPTSLWRPPPTCSGSVHLECSGTTHRDPFAASTTNGAPVANVCSSLQTLISTRNAGLSCLLACQA